MLVEISDEDMEFIKVEAHNRYHSLLRDGEPKKEKWKYAGDCIGEFVVCSVVGVDWGSDVSATRLSRLRIKFANEHWRGLTIASTEPDRGVYVLVTPAYTQHPSNGYYLRGWMTGEAMRLLRPGPKVKDREHVRIVDRSLLWEPSALRDWVWALEVDYEE